MKEVTYEDWQKNPTPRMMWVWDDNIGDKVKRYFHAHYPILALTENSTVSVGYKHCAEPKYRRMTNQELAWWLLDGIKDGKHREWKFELEIDSTIRSIMNYSEVQAKNVLVRENGGEWREPLVEVGE